MVKSLKTLLTFSSLQHVMSMITLKMKAYFLPLAIFLLTLALRGDSTVSEILKNPSKESIVRDPTVLLAILARNAAHLLPNWLGCVENLDYPKDRISIWIVTDHNEDNTSSILREWAKNVKPLYHRVLINVTESPKNYGKSDEPSIWTTVRYLHVAKLRQRALDAARKRWADYLFFIDCDNFLFNSNTLRSLMEEKKIVVSPMLEVFGNKSAYSNYWGGMDDEGYYKRTDQYFSILNREELGRFEVPMIHSTYLVDLRKKLSSQLTYYPPHPDYKGEIDDILVFAHSARMAGIKLYVLNRDIYGQMMLPSESGFPLEEIKIHFLDAKLGYYVDHSEHLMPLSPHVSVIPVPADKLVFDEIYMINLKRRPLRRRRMMASLDELGIKVKSIDAVDGKALTDAQVKEMGIKMLPTYYDPYHKRPLTMGEIGCFLSHYLIWEEMINNGLKMVLVLEDDIRFEPDFRRKLLALMDEAREIDPKYNWDMIYLGRKLFTDDNSERIPNASRIAWADYSYWTIGYVLSLSGARKLISVKPLERMLALDEFLPIMYNKHSNYVGRRRMKTERIGHVDGAKYINYVNYTWWTLGYVIKLQGARKLISAKPLSKMIALDEFIPIMYDKHPNAEWSGHFYPRNLVAMTAEPLLLFPTHYIGDKGYFSDTETTAFVPEELRKGKEKNEL